MPFFNEAQYKEKLADCSIPELQKKYDTKKAEYQRQFRSACTQWAHVVTSMGFSLVPGIYYLAKYRLVTKHQLQAIDDLIRDKRRHNPDTNQGPAPGPVVEGATAVAVGPITVGGDIVGDLLGDDGDEGAGLGPETGEQDPVTPVKEADGVGGHTPEVPTVDDNQQPISGTGEDQPPLNQVGHQPEAPAAAVPSAPLSVPLPEPPPASSEPPPSSPPAPLPDHPSEPPPLLPPPPTGEKCPPADSEPSIEPLPSSTPAAACGDDTPCTPPQKSNSCDCGTQTSAGNSVPPPMEERPPLQNPQDDAHRLPTEPGSQPGCEDASPTPEIPADPEKDTRACSSGPDPDPTPDCDETRRSSVAPAAPGSETSPQGSSAPPGAQVGPCCAEPQDQQPPYSAQDVSDPPTEAPREHPLACPSPPGLTPTSPVPSPTDESCSPTVLPPPAPACLDASPVLGYPSSPPEELQDGSHQGPEYGLREDLAVLKLDFEQPRCNIDVGSGPAAQVGAQHAPEAVA